MLSSFFTTTTSHQAKGVGYGGYQLMDTRNYQQGRQNAAVGDSARDKALVAFLIASAAALRKGSTLPESPQFPTLSVCLSKVFEDLVPSEWDKRPKVMVLALTCFSLCLQHRNDLLGNIHENTSLLYAFENFSHFALFIEQHSGDKSRPTLVIKRILGLRAQVKNVTPGLMIRTSQGVNDANNNQSAASLYKKVMSAFSFDVCDTMANHAFLSVPASNLSTRALFRELSQLSRNLPCEYGSSIFVRALEGRMDLLRALIIGPEGTPYANGCFFFDICLHDYPTQPPKVKFLTTGSVLHRPINPNLYSNGKVCLSLLGTFSGPGWIRGESTLLQVLISIQALIFVDKPIYNEPMVPAFVGALTSNTYNKRVLRHTLEFGILPCLSDNYYPEFREILYHHYRLKRDKVQAQCYSWLAQDSSLSDFVPKVVTKLNTHRHKKSKV